MKPIKRYFSTGMSKVMLLLILSLIVVSSSVAQQSPKDERSPIAMIQSIADRLIDHTDFHYQLSLQKSNENFGGIKQINFARTFGSGTAAIAYAITNVESPLDTALNLQVSHSDGLKIWLNDKLVYKSIHTGRAFVKYRERSISLSDTFRVNIHRGTNQMLIKSETKGKNWQVYIGPVNPVNNLKLTLRNLKYVDSSLAGLSNFLCIGPFPNSVKNHKSIGLDTPYEPEKGFATGIIYNYQGKQLTWTLPRIEIVGAGTGTQLAWGDHNYSWNYHAGGTAWAMAQLGDYVGKPAYKQYAQNYADFFVKERPFLRFEKYQLGELDNGDAKIFESHMLDFTGAPALVYTYLLQTGKIPTRNNAYWKLLNDIDMQVSLNQTRSPSGNFVRSTPHRFTTWADDMFMGIPFLIHLASLTKNSQKKAALMNDAANQLLAFHEQLCDPVTGLYHQAQYSDKKVNIAYWSRANGWAIWAYMEVLTYLPTNHPCYQLLMNQYKAHIDALTRCQDPTTGFWHNVIDHSDTYPETSGTAIFTMAIARGIFMRWIDKSFVPYALRGWQAVSTMVEENGTLHGTCIGTNISEHIEDYYNRPVADNDTHGIFPVIFAGIAINELYKYLENY